MQKRKIKLGILSLALFVSIAVLSGCADKLQDKNKNQSQNQEQERVMEQKRDGSGDGQGRMGNPPAEMTEACGGKSEGDSCEITMPPRNGEDNNEERKFTGICRKFGNNESLSCTPSNMPQGGMKGSPMPAEE